MLSKTMVMVTFVACFVMQGCSGGLSSTGVPPAPVHNAKFSNWTTVDTISIGQNTNNVAPVGNTLYSMDQWNGLTRIDVNSLDKVVAHNNVVSNSVPVGVADNFNIVAMAGNIACVAVIPGGYTYSMNRAFIIHLYDVSDATNPKYLSEVNIPTSNMIADGNYLYVSGKSAGSSKLSIIDISSPSQPTTLGTVTIQNPGKLAKQGNKIFISQLRVDTNEPNNFDKIQVVDVTNPSAPTLVGPAYVASWSSVTYSGIVVNGDVAYVYDWARGLYVLDISNNLSPAVITTIAQPDNIYSIALHGSYLYLACGTAGLKVYDVTNPRLPVLARTITNAAPVKLVAVTTGKGVYITDALPASVGQPPNQQRLNIFYLDN